LDYLAFVNLAADRADFVLSWVSTSVAGTLEALCSKGAVAESPFLKQ
jgi:hypothetical protein